MNEHGLQLRLRRRVAVLTVMLLAWSALAAFILPSSLTAQQRKDTPATGSGAAPHALVFKNAAVVDVDAGKVIPGRTVVIEGNRIRDVGDASQLTPPPGAQVVDAQGKYLIPGLWDMHTHVRGSADVFFPFFIATGVTGIRDMDWPLSPFDTMLKFRREIMAGTRVGPRIFATGRMLEVEGDADAEPFVKYVADPEAGRKAVDDLKAAGADFVKVHSGLMPRETYFAIAAEARKLGIPFLGHLPNDVTLAEASDSGQRSIEHLNEFPSTCMIQNSGIIRQEPLDDKECEALGAQFVRNGTWFTPTLVVFDERSNPQDVYRRYLPPASTPPLDGRDDTRAWVLTDGELLVEATNKVGVPMLAGTDGYGSLQRELALLVESGLTPIEALRTATINPAKSFKATDSLGTVAPGKLADLVLLDADPLTNINNTTKIGAVVANGRYYDRAALDALLAELE